MKRFIAVFSIFLPVLASAAAQTAELTFTFTRQSGSASNQYAVWIEDAQGNYIKTLSATRYTANGGYKVRPSSVPQWVKKSGLSGFSKSQVDAVTSATPRNGNVICRWDGADSKGAAVPAGAYVLILEGTLRNNNQVYYRAPFRVGQGAEAAPVSVEYTGPGAEKEKSMISDVKVRVLR
jgi:hypothetical protein